MKFATHSRYFKDYYGPLFKNSILGNYQLLHNFPGSNAAAQLPNEISKLLGRSTPYVGAYPPIKIN